MLEIITDKSNFGGWKDCYYYMKEFNLKEINVLETRYCLQKIFGKNHYTLEEVRKMAFDDLRGEI